MKRILSLTLAAVMLLAALPALADDPDPICGVWCGDIRIADPPQLPALAGLTHGVILVVAENDGTLWSGELDFLADKTLSATGPSVVGTWKATDDGYIASVVSVGEYPAYIRNETLYIQLLPGIYYRLYRMPEMNFYADIIDASLIQYK